MYHIHVDEYGLDTEPIATRMAVIVMSSETIVALLLWSRKKPHTA